MPSPRQIIESFGDFLQGEGGTALGGVAGAGLLYDAYQDLGDIGGQGLRLGQELAETQLGQATFRPYTITTPTGAMFTARMGGQPFGQPMAQPIGQPSMALPPQQPGIGRSGAAKPTGTFTGGFMGQGRQVYTPPTTPPPGQDVIRGINRPALPGQPMAPAVGGEGLQVGMQLSPQEQALQQQLMGQARQQFGRSVTGQPQLAQAGLGAIGAGQQLMGQPTFGMAPTQAASQQAFGLGGQFMGAAGAQPFDLNLLRGEFAGAVGGMLGQQPSAAVGQLGQQALGLGGAGLVGGAPDVTQTFAGVQAPGVSTAAGGLAGQLMGAGAAERGMMVPDVSQTFAGVAAPGVRTGAGDLAARGLGLGMAGLETAAPTDVEALRQQYGGLAGQAAQQVLQPTAAREAEVFERIRATQRPEEERQRLALEERLAAQGRLGVRSAAFGGATPEQLALATAQEEAQDRASLAAMQQAGVERQRALGEAQALGGMFTQQAGLSSQLQSQAQQRASQLSQLGLSAERVQAQLEAEGFGRQLQLGQAGLQAAQAQSALRSQAQQRANQLSQLGLSAEQVQSRMEAEGFGREMQLAGAGLQAQQAQSALESQAQQRATQLAQLGLSAEQIQSRLQTEGLGRATTAAGQAAQLAQVAGGLQAQQAGLGAQFAGLGANLAQQQQALDAARQQQALQALTAGQGLLSGGLGLQQLQQQLGLSALAGSYLPQQQFLAALAPGQTAAAQQQQAQLYGTGLFGEATASGIDALLGANLGRANLIGAAGSGLLGGIFNRREG